MPTSTPSDISLPPTEPIDISWLIDGSSMDAPAGKAGSCTLP